jgi:putative PIN family toxin of toxin-antitoxin system
MTEVQIELSATARAAREAGLLTSEALERLLTDAIRRRQAADALLAIADRLAEAGIEPMSMKEIDREVKPFVTSAGDVRAVVDTKVLLSGFWRGRPDVLLEQARAGALTLISSPALLAELAEVMNRPKFQEILARSSTDLEPTLGELRRLAEIIDAPRLPAPVSRDPSDDAVLALATASQADLIITGDAAFLTLGSHAGIPIINPAEAITRISG